MFKEKLSICLYEENYYTEKIIQIQENTEEPSVEVIDKVSNKVSTKKLTNKSDNKLPNELTNESINELTNEKVNSNSTSWYDTDKFNKIPSYH